MTTARPNASGEGAEVGGEFAEGSQQRFGLGGAKAGGGRERAEDADGVDSGSAGHFNVFGGVADVDAFFGAGPQALEGEFYRGRVRLFLCGVLAVDADRKVFGEFEMADLLAHAGTTSAGHDAELVVQAKPPQHAARTRKQSGAFLGVGAAPEEILLCANPCGEFRRPRRRGTNWGNSASRSARWSIRFQERGTLPGKPGCRRGRSSARCRPNRAEPQLGKSLFRAQLRIVAKKASVGGRGW